MTVCEVLKSFLPSPLKDKLCILPYVLWTWHPGAAGVASIVPQYDVDAVVQIELEPLVRVLLQLGIPEIGVANDDGARCADLGSMNLLESVRCREPKNL